MLIRNGIKSKGKLAFISACLTFILALTSCKEFERKSYLYFDQSYSFKITKTYQSRGGFFMYSDSLQNWLVLPEAIGCSNGKIVKLSDRVASQVFQLSKDSLSSKVFFETSYLKDSIEFEADEEGGLLWIIPNCE